MSFKRYNRKGFTEATPYESNMDMTGVSISDADKANGSPKKGDMIARNPDDYNDMWLIAEDWFNDNYEN